MTKINEPLYRMVINGKIHWMLMRDAGISFDCGWVPVTIGGQVMDIDGSVREITVKERQQISDIADEWSASK